MILFVQRIISADFVTYNMYTTLVEYQPQAWAVLIPAMNLTKTDKVVLMGLNAHCRKKIFHPDCPQTWIPKSE